MPNPSHALAVLRGLEGFLDARLRALRATGAPRGSAFVKAVEELHRILEEMLPAPPDLPGSSGRAPRMAIRPRRGGQRPVPASGDVERTFVVDYSRELLCLARAGVRSARHGTPASDPAEAST